MKTKQAKTESMDSKQLQQKIEALQAERLEVLQQLRLGASTNVRKPSLIRRQIASLLTRLRQLEQEPVIVKVAAGNSSKEDK